MAHSITDHRTRWARVTFSGREGLTLAHVREFLAEADAAEIPEETRVRVEDKLAGEGANRSGCIESRHQSEVTS